MKQPEKLITKQFPLTTLAVVNRTSVMILTLIIVVFGLIAYTTMPKESFPEVVIPQIYIGTAYPGNSPVDMENLITRPIEKELKSVAGLKKITSTSVQDYSTIIAEFNTGVNIPKALQDVKDKVDQAKSDLPNDLDQDPQVFEINFSEIPIMFINLSGNFSLSELKGYAEYLQDEIEKFPEISYAQLRGALEREIRIDADLYKMKSVNVTFNDIYQAIASENITISGGNLKSGEFRRSIRVVSEFEDVSEIEDIIVKSEKGNIVYLRDVAEVKDTNKEVESYARSSKLPVITLNVVKRSGKNIVEAADKINKLLAESKQSRFPKGLDISITTDQSKQIKFMVSNLENSIISGVILVVLVLLFFMGLRSALFVGVAIPISMFISFIVLNMFGVTLNMMILFSLILALGMLVDNGIVVVENIYRLLEEGYPIKKAVIEGVGEIAVPIISSTATTVAAFLPLAFWDGILGSFMKYLPITLIISLSASLFVALVINPALAVFFAKLDKGESKVTPRNLIMGGAFILFSVPFYLSQSYFWANLLMSVGVFMYLHIFLLNPGAIWFQKYFLVWLENAYSKVIYFALHGWRPYLFFGGTIALLFISIILVSISNLQSSLFPNNEPMYINIFIQKPIGTDIEETNALTKEIEDKVVKMMQPYGYMIDAIIAQVGEGTSDPMEGPSQDITPHKAKVTVSFKEFEFRKGVSTGVLLEEVRELVKGYAGVRIIVDKDAAGPPVGAPINIEVSGEDFDKLIQLSENLEKYLEEANIPGIEELKTDLQTGKPELLVQVNREKARRLGISSRDIATELRTALFGLEVSKFKQGEDEYPIQLRLKDDQRYNLEALKNKTITLNDQGNIRQIPITAVADLKYSSSYGSVKRKDLDKVIAISSNVKEGYNANEIVAQLKTLVDTFPIPEGFTVKFTGEQEEQQESAEFLFNAFLLALFMVFLIIVSQFNSLTAPVIIMFSVLFSTIGVFLGLVAFRMDFIILMTGIGIISLAGVVVNNAIVLIDYTDLLRLRRKADLGMQPEDHLPTEEFLHCIAEAGRTRLRPVLLTAITTVLGLIPLATGFNIDFYGMLAHFRPNIYWGGDNESFFGPMAWTVIFGLSFATFLTLVIVPVMYLLADKFKGWLKGKLRLKKEVEKKEMHVSF